MYVGVRCSQSVCDRTGSVWRVVIGYQNVDLGYRLTNSTGNELDVLSFVVRRHDYENPA